MSSPRAVVVKLRLEELKRSYQALPYHLQAIYLPTYERFQKRVKGSKQPSQEEFSDMLGFLAEPQAKVPKTDPDAIWKLSIIASVAIVVLAGVWAGQR